MLVGLLALCPFVFPSSVSSAPSEWALRGGSSVNPSWSSTDAIPRWMGREPSGRPEAELWLGAHPSDPSSVELDAERCEPLDAWIARDPEAALGTRVADPRDHLTLDHLPPRGLAPPARLHQRHVREHQSGPRNEDRQGRSQLPPDRDREDHEDHREQPDGDETSHPSFRR